MIIRQINKHGCSAYLPELGLWTLVYLWPRPRLLHCVVSLTLNNVMQTHVTARVDMIGLGIGIGDPEMPTLASIVRFLQQGGGVRST